MSLSITNGLFTLPVAAGKTEALNVAGRYIAIVSAPYAIGVQVDEQPEVIVQAGVRWSYPAPDFYRRLTVRNPGTAPIAPVIWLGFGEFIDNRHEKIEASTDVVGWSGNIPAATEAGPGSVTFSPVLTGNRARRKAVIVSNYDASANLYVADTAGNTVATVFPLQCVTLPISQPCQVRNPGGAPIAAAVGEIYWLV